MGGWHACSGCLLQCCSRLVHCILNCPKFALNIYVNWRTKENKIIIYFMNKNFFTNLTASFVSSKKLCPLSIMPIKLIFFFKFHLIVYCVRSKWNFTMSLSMFEIVLFEMSFVLMNCSSGCLEDRPSYV